MANISNSIQDLETSRLSNISDPGEIARVQALFKTCQDMVKDTNVSLDNFTDMVSVKLGKIKAVHVCSAQPQESAPCLTTPSTDVVVC